MIETYTRFILNCDQYQYLNLTLHHLNKKDTSNTNTLGPNLDCTILDISVAFISIFY